MTWNPDRPYNDLPLLPPPALKDDFDWRPVLNACKGAEVALKELTTASRGLNQELLINSIPRLEAQVSSEIEGVFTTTDEMFVADYRKDNELDRATKEALGYADALTKYSGRPLDAHLAEQICSSLRNKETTIRQRLDTKIARTDGQTIYTPPQGEEIIREKLKNWANFLFCPALEISEGVRIEGGSVEDIREEKLKCDPESGYDPDLDKDPIIRLAIGHYQFEAIHPFEDGNGRTGRILNVLFLINAGLLEYPILYHSRGVLKRKDDYYRLLRQVTETGDWGSWIIFIAEVIRETAEWTVEQIAAINQLKEDTKNYVHNRLGDKADQRMLDLIFKMPVVAIPDVVDEGIAKRQTASTKLKQLSDLGILKQVKEGRNVLFKHTKFLSILKQTEKYHVEQYAAPDGAAEAANTPGEVGEKDSG